MYFDILLVFSVATFVFRFFFMIRLMCLYVFVHTFYCAHGEKVRVSLTRALFLWSRKRTQWMEIMNSEFELLLFMGQFFFLLCLHCCCHCYYLRMLWWYIKKYIHLCLHAYESIVRMWTCEHVCVCVDLDTLWVNEMFGIHFSPENIFLFHIFLFLSHSIIHERVIVVRMIFKLSFGLRF